MEIENIKIKPVWPKTKEEVWADVFEPLHEQQGKKGLLRRLPLWSYAASLLIPILLFCHFYTVTENTDRGEQAIVQLPDRSTVTLNAESRLSYKPLTWFISRKVRLEGEAYFEVESGSRFSVLSGSHRVSVLGTVFNVHARTKTYQVTCLYGKVEVQAGGRETVELHPQMQAIYNGSTFSVYSDVATAKATGWMQGKFVFDETPLPDVIAEVERQYNIDVAPNYEPNHLYTGNFSKTENSPEDVLDIIGKAFGITFSFK